MIISAFMETANALLIRIRLEEALRCITFADYISGRSNPIK